MSTERESALLDAHFRLTNIATAILLGIVSDEEAIRLLEAHAEHAEREL